MSFSKASILLPSLPYLHDVKNRFLHFFFAIIVCCTDVTVFLFVCDGSWMIRVCNHVAGGLLRQCPDVSGRARTGVHLAMRSGDSVDPPHKLIMIDLMQMFFVFFFVHSNCHWEIVSIAYPFFLRAHPSLRSTV